MGAMGPQTVGGRVCGQAVVPGAALNSFPRCPVPRSLAVRGALLRAQAQLQVEADVAKDTARHEPSPQSLRSRQASWETIIKVVREGTKTRSAPRGPPHGQHTEPGCGSHLRGSRRPGSCQGCTL